jgi:hypothetical protein
MNEDRLHQLLEAYGADPARWPDNERHHAARLHQAGGVAAAARALDAQLDLYAAPAASARLRQAILDRTRTLPQARPLSLAGWIGDLMPLRPLWPNLAGLAAALVIGFGVGFTDLGAMADTDPAVQSTVFGFESLDDFAL